MADFGASAQAAAAGEVGAQLFPIPPMKRLSLEESFALGRSTGALFCATGLGVDSLNWLAGVSRRPLGTRASSATVSRLAHVHQEIAIDVAMAAVSWSGPGG